MMTLRSLIVIVALASCAFAADHALISGKVLGERAADPNSGGMPIGNVIINVPMPGAPPASSPNASPVQKRIIMVEIGDFIYDWEQVGGQRFTAIPDEPISCYEEKGKWVVERNNRKYEFGAVQFRRK